MTEQELLKTYQPKIWDSAFAHVLSSAIESGSNIEIEISVSLDGSPQARRLVADLANAGARLTRAEDVETAHVTAAVAQAFHEIATYGERLIDPIARG